MGFVGAGARVSSALRELDGRYARTLEGRADLLLDELRAVNDRHVRPRETVFGGVRLDQRHAVLALRRKAPQRERFAECVDTPSLTDYQLHRRPRDKRMMKNREALGWTIAAALLIAVAAAYWPRGETICGTVRVIDGDSLHVASTEVRLYAVDAFEGRQTCGRDRSPWRCGEAATDQLRAMTAGREITCHKRDIDSYGRTVAVCSNGEVDLGAELTRAGLALAYREFGTDYIGEEEEARVARRGAWAGEFDEPWDARRGDTQAAQRPNESDDTSNCRGTGIKGNINREGERIYHVPGSRSYDETKIDERNGERWFCTEDEARNAGWRAPRG
jgi:endonuclease YncB( thermonuclease family)